MKSLSNAVIINGVSYTINTTEAKKVADLLGLNVTANTTTVEVKSEPKTASKTTKTAPKKTTVVGCLEQDGAFVRTRKGEYISSKARYAIKMTATETFGATKLKEGDKVYDALAKEDKYVQVYKFASVKDADKFMAEQSKRLAK